MARKICLVTHTVSTHTEERKVGGWYDSKLTVEGQRQASLLPEKIIDHGFNIQKAMAYSSDLKRASETAQNIIQGHEVKLHLDPRLREMSFGLNEGMSQEEHLQNMMPVGSETNRLDHRICKGAETRREVAERTSEFMREVMQHQGDLLVVIHGFAATFVIAAFLNIEIESLGYINIKLDPGSVSLLQEDDVFINRTIALLNA